MRGHIDDAERAGPAGNQSVMRLWGVNDNKHLRVYRHHPLDRHNNMRSSCGKPLMPLLDYRQLRNLIPLRSGYYTTSNTTADAHYGV